MRLGMIGVVVIILGFNVAAQDMVEYGHAATKPPVSLQSLANKASASSHKPVTQSRVQNIDTGKTLPAAKPTPPAIFILSNGKQLESSHYLMDSNNLVIQETGAEQTIPLSSLDRKATEAANQKRGVNLKIPTSGSQMTLSF
jgi:hypothetical protein